LDPVYNLRQGRNLVHNCTLNRLESELLAGVGLDAGLDAGGGEEAVGVGCLGEGASWGGVLSSTEVVAGSDSVARVSRVEGLLGAYKLMSDKNQILSEDTRTGPDVVLNEELSSITSVNTVAVLEREVSCQWYRHITRESLLLTLSK
jgi:hypothetical protein